MSLPLALALSLTLAVVPLAEAALCAAPVPPEGAAAAAYTLEVPTAPIKVKKGQAGTARISVVPRGDGHVDPNAPSQVTLTWSTATDNSAVSAYRLYRDGTLLTTTGNTGYTDPQPNVNVNGKANYTVQGCDTAGNCSALSSVAAVTLSGTSSAAAKLSVGGNHGAALKSDGSLLMWGSVE